MAAPLSAASADGSGARAVTGRPGSPLMAAAAALASSAAVWPTAAAKRTRMPPIYRLTGAAWTMAPDRLMVAVAGTAELSALTAMARRAVLPLFCSQAAAMRASWLPAPKSCSARAALVMRYGVSGSAVPDGSMRPTSSALYSMMPAPCCARELSNSAT